MGLLLPPISVTTTSNDPVVEKEVLRIKRIMDRRNQFFSLDDMNAEYQLLMGSFTGKIDTWLFQHKQNANLAVFRLKDNRDGKLYIYPIINDRCYLAPVNKTSFHTTVMLGFYESVILLAKCEYFLIPHGKHLFRVPKTVLQQCAVLMSSADSALMHVSQIALYQYKVD